MLAELAPALERSASLAAALFRGPAAEGRLALASSMSAEDMVLMDIITAAALPVTVFTLDTGRLHTETVELISRAQAHFGLNIEVYRPDPSAVEDYVGRNGANAFYESTGLRKTCCGIRKVEPLRRALAGKSGWITGQRRDQSATRTDLKSREFDVAHGIEKFNPLADWSWQDVLEYAAARNVPLNPLHARGYVSIGCEPCTRAIRPGEDPRAGRWWWENSDSKECGLHVAPFVAAGA